VKNRLPVASATERWNAMGGGSQTLVVALFYNMFAGGLRPVYSIDAMAVIYMVMVMTLLLVALRFVRPTQMVFKLDR
jgi:putative spermidine/putrescine transport system permease protein